MVSLESEGLGGGVQAVGTAVRGPRGARGEGSRGLHVPVPSLAVPQPEGPADPQS